MNTPLVMLAVIAAIGIGMMAFADAGVTGQPITIDRLTPEMAKTLAASLDKPKYTPPAQPVCDCPDYSDSILTTEKSFLAGLSKWDCELIKEVIKLRKEMKKSTTHLESWNSACKQYWPY